MTHLKPTPNALPDEAVQILARLATRKAACRRALKQIHEISVNTTVLIIGVEALKSVSHAQLNQAA